MNEFRHVTGNLSQAIAAGCLFFYTNRKGAEMSNTDRELMKAEGGIAGGFAQRLEENLKDVEYSGPQFIGGQDLILLLFEWLTTALQGCLSSRSNSQVARSLKSPTMFQVVQMRRTLRDKLYDGSLTQWQRNDGEGVYQAMMKTTTESSEQELLDMMAYINREKIPGVTDYGIL